jgi:hypothetical protein
MNSARKAARAQTQAHDSGDLATPKPQSLGVTGQRRAITSTELIPLQFKMPADFVKAFKMEALTNRMKLNKFFTACFDAFKRKRNSSRNGVAMAKADPNDFDQYQAADARLKGFRSVVQNVDQQEIGDSSILQYSAVPSAELIPLHFKMPPDFVNAFKMESQANCMKLNELLKWCFHAFKSKIKSL